MEEGVGRMKVKGRRYGGIHKARYSDREEERQRERKTGSCRAENGGP